MLIYCIVHAKVVSNPCSSSRPRRRLQGKSFAVHRMLRKGRRKEQLALIYSRMMTFSDNHGSIHVLEKVVNLPEDDIVLKLFAAEV